jgi:F-type H+-transporting ATPase subunit b
VATLAIAVSNRIIGETLDEQRQRRLIDEFFSGIRAGRVVVLDEEELEWAKRAGAMTAHITTALPLSAGEQETVASSLTEHLGERPELEFEVDPSILGGLVIRIGDRVVDGSVAGKLVALQEQLG